MEPTLDLTYQEQIDILIEYLLSKAQQKDWYGVSDAANDIRVLEAKLEVINEIQRRRSSAY